MESIFQNIINIIRPPKHEDCFECSGTGTVCYSCCGDDIKGNDYDNCPTCLEHCSLEEEVCGSCNGIGIIYTK